MVIAGNSERLKVPPARVGFTPAIFKGVQKINHDHGLWKFLGPFASERFS
jgi:hypothetical protein